jgi:hypothetical protein
MDEFFFQTQLIEATIEQLSKLSDLQFENLLKAINKEGFNRSISRCNKLARELESDLSSRDVFTLLNALEGFYDNSREWEGFGREPLAELFEFAGINGELDGEIIQVGYRRLRELIVVNPVVENLNKYRWLQTGIIDTVVDFSSFVELRPHFADDRSKIEELLPIIIFRILTASDAGTHNSCVFQLTREGMTRMHAALIDAEKKLGVLETDAELKTRIKSDVIVGQEEG